jgi:hypothetical protein
LSSFQIENTPVIATSTTTINSSNIKRNSSSTRAIVSILFTITNNKKNDLTRIQVDFSFEDMCIISNLKYLLLNRASARSFLNHIFVIHCFLGTVPPLTNPLTASQAAAKEIQKQDLVTQTAGQSK